MIKFTYFDVGGVVIRDFSGTTKWEELRRELGITPDQDTEYEKFFDEWESKVCVGLDLETLLPMIREKFHVNIPENYSFL